MLNRFVISKKAQIIIVLLTMIMNNIVQNLCRTTFGVMKFKMVIEKRSVADEYVVFKFMNGVFSVINIWGT